MYKFNDISPAMSFPHCEECPDPVLCISITLLIVMLVATAHRHFATISIFFHYLHSFPEHLRKQRKLVNTRSYSPVHFCPLACNVKTNIHGTNFSGLETISRLIKPLPKHPVWYEFNWSGEHYI